MAYSGKFTPKNLKKYKGDPNNIVYRSLWERQVMVKFDQNPQIVEWASEHFIIPYRSPIDGKMHRYFPDFWVKVLNKDGSITNYIIEVKPKVQTLPPKAPKRKNAKYKKDVATYLINMAKWEAAGLYCKNKDIKFTIWTEETIRPEKRKKRNK